MSDDGRGFAQPRSGRLSARQLFERKWYYIVHVCFSRRTVSAIAEHEICRRACAVFHTPLKIPLDFNPTLLGFAAEGLHGFA